MRLDQNLHFLRLIQICVGVGWVKARNATPELLERRDENKIAPLLESSDAITGGTKFAMTLLLLLVSLVLGSRRGRRQR